MTNNYEPAKIKLSFVNEDDEKLTEQQKLIKRMNDELPFIIETLANHAKLTKAEYDALISEGFKPEEALELCKMLF